MNAVSVINEKLDRLEWHKMIAKRAKETGNTRIYEMALRAIAKLSVELEIV